MNDQNLAKEHNNYRKSFILAIVITLVVGIIVPIFLLLTVYDDNNESVWDNSIYAYERAAYLQSKNLCYHITYWGGTLRSEVVDGRMWTCPLDYPSAETFAFSFCNEVFQQRYGLNIYLIWGFAAACSLILLALSLCLKNNAQPMGYLSLGKHIFLSLFTCGIWPLIWICRTTRKLNEAPNVEQYDPIKKLLLCIFVPFYQIYWYYKHGQRVDALAREKRLNASDMATLCLILGIFIPIVASILMQDRINLICTAPENHRETTPKVTPQQSNADELKKYKELLDMGAITQEEFDAKKKQLLGL